LGQAPTSREELNPLLTCCLRCSEQGEESQSRSHDKIGRFLGTSNAASRILRNPFEKDFHDMEPPFLHSQRLARFVASGRAPKFSRAGPRESLRLFPVTK